MLPADDTQTPMDAPLTQTQWSGLPLPVDAGLSFWKSEIDRAEDAAKPYHSEWQDNVSWYIGKSPDAAAALTAKTDHVNVNVDFYQVEQKQAQLFYETPELQMKGTGLLEGHDDIVQAHRLLMDEILGDSHVDVLTTVHEAIKSCLCVENTGPVLLGYQPTLREVTPPMQPGSILGLNGPVQVPIHEQWYALAFSRRKLLVPADYKSTNWGCAFGCRWLWGFARNWCHRTSRARIPAMSSCWSSRTRPRTAQGSTTSMGRRSGIARRCSTWTRGTRSCIAS